MTFFRHVSSDESSTSGGGGNSGDDVRDRLATNATKLLRSMKQLLAREKTLTITPKKNSLSGAGFNTGNNHYTVNK